MLCGIISPAPDNEKWTIGSHPSRRGLDTSNQDTSKIAAYMAISILFCAICLFHEQAKRRCILRWFSMRLISCTICVALFLSPALMISVPFVGWVPGKMRDEFQRDGKFLIILRRMMNDSSCFCRSKSIFFSGFLIIFLNFVKWLMR